MHPDLKSGEVGFKLGKSVWEDPYYRKLMGLPPGKPFETYKPQGPAMGYYNAGGQESFGVLMSDQNPDPSSSTRVTPALAAWRASHPGQEYPSGGGYRRINPGNVKALRRSMRRVQAFAKLARKTIQFTQRVKMRKRGKR